MNNKGHDDIMKGAWLILLFCFLIYVLIARPFVPEDEVDVLIMGHDGVYLDDKVSKTCVRLFNKSDFSLVRSGEGVCVIN